MYLMLHNDSKMLLTSKTDLTHKLGIKYILKMGRARPPMPTRWSNWVEDYPLSKSEKMGNKSYEEGERD